MLLSDKCKLHAAQECNTNNAFIIISERSQHQTIDKVDKQKLMHYKQHKFSRHIIIIILVKNELTLVKTEEAVVHDKQGTAATGLGHRLAVRVTFYIRY